jgi:sarcosine oxidase subunit alpha
MVSHRLGKNHFLMTTTTGGAARVLAWLKVAAAGGLTGSIAPRLPSISTIALVGPKSRQLLQELVTDLDLSKDAFPFMHSRVATIDGIPIRIARISFSGELAFEINVAWGNARHIWERLWALGPRYDLTVYGTETMHVLRAEKGYIIVGQDTDGTQAPHDLNMSWRLSQEEEFIGSAPSNCLSEGNRTQLVGLLTEL